MRSVFLFCCLFPALAGFGQRHEGTRVYGYVQPVSRGMAGRHENPSSMVNYYIYLSSTAKTRIYPVEIWIKGERLGVQAEAVHRTPVTLTKDEAVAGSGEIILVPQTTAKVWRLTGTTEPAQKNFSRAKHMAKTHELVVVYKTGGRFYYAALEKFSELASGLRQ